LVYRVLYELLLMVNQINGTAEQRIAD